MSAMYRFTRFAVTTTGVLGGVAALRYNQILQRNARDLPTAPLPWPTVAPDVIIIGGGVVGIATAYTCANRGQRVLVIEPNTQAGQECTSCAAGGMQRSNPVVDAKTWLAVLKSSFGVGYQFFHIDWLQTLTDPFFLRWIFTFSTTSLLPGKDQPAKQHEMLKFTQFAVDEMIQFMNKHMAQVSGYNPTGSLSISYDPPPPPVENVGVAKANNPVDSKMNLEPQRRLNSTAEILRVEPSLRFQQVPPQTAKFEYKSSAASAERYTVELARLCAHHPNVTLLYNTTVRDLKVNSSTDDKPYISALSTSAGVLPVSPQTQVVVATGAWIPHLLATADLYAPVYPLKGYAISLSANHVLKQSNGKLRNSDLPSRVVADAFMFTSRLGDEIRITSVGEFSGWSTQPTPSVDKAFRDEAARQFPQLAPFLPAAKTRCGHRPYVNDGLVLMGRYHGMQNLLLSCGPGSNGWKMAMGSAVVIQGLAAGKSEAQLSQELGFDVSVFAPTNRVLPAPLFAKLCRARWNF